MRITLQQIANKLGITKAAVSMALRNSSRISAERRDEVQRIAKEMGYEPDPFLSRLSAYRTRKPLVKSEGVIAWLNHWSEPKGLRRYKEFDLYWRGATEASKRLGYRLDEVIWPADRTANEMERLLLGREVLGILIPPHPPDVNWGNFDWSRFSLIRFGLSVNNPDSNLVTADHQRAVVMAVQKIHEYGYRRIGLVLDADHERSLGGNITGGFLWAQRMLKLPEMIPPLKYDLRHSSGGAVAFKAKLDGWMKMYRPDAILDCLTEVPVHLRELGYRIPQDVAIAGTSIYDIPLDAGIDQHSRSIGRIAAEMLIKQISLDERGQPEEPCRILVESRWKDGSTLPRKRHRRGP